jgi:uncharacterized membrane protein
VDDYLRDVLDLLFRYLHVVAGIAWIGASFYFIRLDLSLKPPADPRDTEEGVSGELWGVHGGGFYHSQKYPLGPRVLPGELHWFKWEAYTTWLSGFALLVVLYWTDAKTRLIDPSVADLETWQAILISGGSLVAGWLVYDAMCRFVADDRLLALGVGALAVFSAWGLGELLAARAAFLQVGAMLGTIMAANVFFSIIPAHWELVRAKEAGREPSPAPGRDAKRRSVHNNYLTLPVVFTMLAGHFAFTWSRDHAWLVLVAIFALVVVLRHFFNLWHQGKRAWWIPIVVAAGAAALAVALRPDDDGAATKPGPTATFAQAQAIVNQRCVPCHQGASAPNGVKLDTREGIELHADEIEELAVRSKVMPPGNATGMTDAERATLGAWLASR